MKLIRNNQAPVLAALLLSASPGQAAVTPSHFFQEGMVLQREMKVPVWGQADPGEKVTVDFSGQRKAVVTGANGKWQVDLDPMPASATPTDLSIAGSNTVTLKNVVVGEVWLASGQSNMQLSLNVATNHQAEVAAADFPLIRGFTVHPEGSLTPLDDVKGIWRVCTPQTAGEFSAVAYFFARDLFQNLQIPVGIIDSSYGGTPAEAWTSQEAMDSVPELKNVADQQTAALRAAPGDLARFPAAISA